MENTETRKALEGSIEKWEKIVRNPRAQDMGIANCPLCKRFGGSCMIQETKERCPVRIKAKRCGCIGTPHTKWCNHQERKHNVNFSAHRFKGCDKCMELAKAELDFLKSLLPKKKARQ